MEAAATVVGAGGGGGGVVTAGRTWLLVYTRAGSRLPWLVVANVPSDVKRAEVLAHLETWRRWQAFAPGPAGRLSLVPFERAGELHGDVGATQAVAWAELAPEAVRTTLELPGDVHARVVMAARRSGRTQAAWMADVVAAAAAAELGA